MAPIAEMTSPLPVPRSPSPYHPGRSADTRSAPFSMAWAEIHTSLVGMGLPLALGIQEDYHRQRDSSMVSESCSASSSSTASSLLPWPKEKPPGDAGGRGGEGHDPGCQIDSNHPGGSGPPLFPGPSPWCAPAPGSPRPPASITTSVQGGMWGDARMAARRLAWERRARSLLSCVSCSHRSNSSGPNRSRGSISRTTR